MTTIQKENKFSPKKILSMIAKEAQKNDFTITRNAEQDMQDQGVSFEELEQIIYDPKWFVREDKTSKGQTSYKIKGHNLHKAVVTIDKEGLTVIAVMNKVYK